MRAGRLLLVMSMSLAVTCQAQSSVSLDCTKAISTTAKMVCSDKELQSLDAQLEQLYLQAGRRPEVIAQQRRDLFRADGCGKAEDSRACVEAAYQRRILSLKIEQGTAGPAIKARFDCGTVATRFSASFYNGVEPQSVMLVNGNDHALALIAPSGSGSRYTAPGIEYWEHQGEAAVTWRGTKMTCRIVR